MEGAYRPEVWHDLYVMLGGASAALTGMLFVALTLHLNEIMGSPPLRRRVANNFFALALIILMAALQLMPQRQECSGIEIIAINIFALYLPGGLLLRFRHRLPKDAFVRAAVSLVGFGGALAGGALLLTASMAGQALLGMFLVAFGNLIVLFLVISNAWSIMAGAYRDESLPKIAD